MRRLLLLVLIVAVAGMFYFGWLTFSDDSTTSTIQLNKTEVETDTEHAVEKVKEVIHEGADAAKNAVDANSRETRE